jgi:hypothetical protein
MTPKEKAKELVNKYLGFEIDDYKDPEMGSTLYRAKSNALICVDEIINIIGIMKQGNLILSYWLDVKQEIQQL